MQTPPSSKGTPSGTFGVIKWMNIDRVSAVGGERHLGYLCRSDETNEIFILSKCN